MPQGTLAERIRAGGAGIPAFYTPTSYGTDLAEGKPVAEFDGRIYVQERWLKADVALVKAELADTHGQPDLSQGGAEFLPLMCMAAADDDRPGEPRRASRAASTPSMSSRPASSCRRVVEVPDPRAGRRAEPRRRALS